MRLERVVVGDFLAGFTCGMVTWLVIGWWSLIPAVACGGLWVMGGQGILGTKAWRRAGVPLVICGVFASKGYTPWLTVSFALQWCVHSLGYGEESIQPYDEGSWLGRHFGKFTRYVWFAILALSMMPLIFL